MATTATLNGGPTGGLHATPTTLIHTDNPPPEETCRVDSNSSFESGHEEAQHIQLPTQSESGGLVGIGPINGGGGDECTDDVGEVGNYDDPSTPTNNNTTTAHNNAYFNDLSELSSKKRRKQSRPVRIPLDPSDTGTGGLGSPPPPPLPPPIQEEGEVLHLKGHRSLRPHVPLNLSSRNDQQQSSSSEEEGEAKCSSFNANNRNRQHSFSENDKTELHGGQGTKDLPHLVRPSTTGSPSSHPPSFSPGLFPLGSAGAPSPFSSLFSANLNIFAQQQQLQQHHTQNHGPAGTPTSSSSAGSNSGFMVGNVSALQNLPPHRIFNPEAYCDLCNKEFCNKYFLKTHKANKHGVYSEMSPSLGMGQVIGVNSSSNTSFLTGAAILSSAALASNTTSTTNSGPILSSSIATGNTNSPACSQQQGTGAVGINPGSNSGTGSNNLAKGTVGGISSEIPFSLASFSLEKGAGNSNGSQRESFCELCQKEFCNKYFLKRHKAKIHGIPVDSHSSTGSGRSSSSSNHGKSSSGRPFSNGGGGDKGLSSLRELGLESLGLEIVAKHLEEANRASGVTDLGGREEGELSADDETREKSPDNEGESDENENSPFKMSTQNSSSNVENSCQFCLRDFSSKQHLINHLLKKHRLLIPSSFPPFLFPFPALFEEQGGDGEGASGHPLLDNSSTNAIVGGDGDFECSFCNRSFQTVYLLRMHKSYFHPDSSQDQEETEIEKYNSGPSFLSKARSHHHQHRPKRNTAPENQGGHGDHEEHDETEEFTSEHDESDHGGSEKGSPSLQDDNNGKRRERDNKQGKDGKKPLSSPSIAEIEGRGDATSDSDDLRRLQTMIMELNRVSSAAVAWSPPMGEATLVGAHLSLPPPLGTSMGGVAGSSSTHCGICNKEFYSSYFLQQHILHFHSSNNGGDSYGGIKSESPLNSIMMSSCSGRSGTPTTDSHGAPIRIKTESLFSSELGSSGGGGGGSKKSDSTSTPGITISPETLKERLLNQEAFGSVGDGGSGLGGLGSGGTSSTFLTPGPKGVNNNNPINKDGPKRPSPSLSRSYCTICHKELCNKYFMRTHMLKMHGISIESSTGLGGVTCDVCNKELCSKYFLKVHKQNTHGIVEDGPSPPNPSTPGPIPLSSMGLAPTSSSTPTSIANNFPLLGNSGSLTGLNLSTNSSTSSPSLSEGAAPPDHNSLPLLPKEAGDLSSRYFCHYSEVCPFCGRRFRSPKWLKTHLQQDHGEEGRERWKSIERSLRRSQKNSSSSNNPSSSKSGGNYPHCSSIVSKGGSSSLQGHNNSNKVGRDRPDGNKCAFCSFSTGDVETMKSHLIKEHSSQLANRQALSDAAALNSGIQEAQSSGMLLDPLTMLFQKMDGGNTKIYRCAYCPFTTSILVYLYAHERTHTGQLGSGSGGTGGGEAPPAFQCPMCFHAFDQPEAFQQHLIGHQMSGVLAPFFTPSASASSGSGRLGFLSSPNGGDHPDHRNLLSLPLLNGSAGDSLYWALKNNAPSNNSSSYHQGNGEEDKCIDESNEPPADLTTEARKKRAHEETDVELESDLLRPRKKVLRFRCSYCQSRFPSRELALAHVHQVHGAGNGDATSGGDGDGGKQHIGLEDSKRFKKNFRCRKCKFTSATYQMLVVHNKLQHSAFRSTSHGPSTTSTGTGPCEELTEGHGVAQEDGQFMMQGFLLTSSEEENSNQFVPSVVYLPVREKVSQSIRVSFSLTPTSTSEPQQEASSELQHQ